jgi:helix-hairpin-helix protein
MPRRAQGSKRTGQEVWVPSGVDPARIKPVPLESREKSDGVEEWLPRESEARSEGVEEWLPEPAPRPSVPSGGSEGNGVAGGVEHSERPRTATPSPRKQRRLPKRSTPRERWLLTRLRRKQRRVEEQKHEIELLKSRLSELEGTAEEAEDGRHDGKLDLNEASLDDLRQLGLNATQSARLMAYRERAQGFDSIDEIEQIPGFGQATLRRLREQAHARGG